jgi:hypothetical protein
MPLPHWFPNWLRKRDGGEGRRSGAPCAGSFRPAFELLEDRLAPSVTPSHLYAFNGNLNDAFGGPTLLSDGGTISGGRYVFGMDQGLRLDGALANTSTYSVALSFSFNSLTLFFNKVIDFQQRAQDVGLYVSNSHLQLYPGVAGSGTVTANQDFQVVLTRDGTTGETDVYLNGVLQMAYVGQASARSRSSATARGPGTAPATRPALIP